MKREGLITHWSDRDIDAGKQWEHEIHENLNTADIILLLISPDFIASEYCYKVEMARALERHKAGEAYVLPIILHPCSWEKTPLKTLQVLPREGRPLTTWTNRNQAFLNIVENIGNLVEKLTSDHSS